MFFGCETLWKLHIFKRTKKNNKNCIFPLKWLIVACQKSWLSWLCLTIKILQNSSIEIQFIVLKKFNYYSYLIIIFFIKYTSYIQLYTIYYINILYIYFIDYFFILFIYYITSQILFYFISIYINSLLNWNVLYLLYNK